ncbi:MAG: cell division protein ZapA [Tannerella sp.]|jgi:cell division protein ZapA (FtsZ GTPase activity inhibitor)|nr:cell division protein ZapA [Tannerella sp.]
MSEKLSINLELIPGFRKFPLKIEAEEEPVVREIAEKLRQKFVQYKQKFIDVSDLEIMAMVALDMVRTARKNDAQSVLETVSRMSEQLKSYLKQQP